MSLSWFSHFYLAFFLSALICAGTAYSSRLSYGEETNNPNLIHLDRNGPYEDTRSNEDRYLFDRATKKQLNRFTEPDNYLNLNLWDVRNPNEPIVPTRSFFNLDDSKEDTDRFKSKSDAGFQVFSSAELPVQSKGLLDDGRPVVKREGHSLSIVNPLDVLRQKLMLEMARRRMKENQDQIRANDRILKTLGKRSSDSKYSSSSSFPSSSEEAENAVQGENTRMADARRSHRMGFINRSQESGELMSE